MNRCPNCQYETLPTSTFCERCGTSLAPSSSPLEPTYRASSDIAPPPPGFALYHPLAPSQRQRQRHKRTMGGTILRLLVFLWGVLCFSFGLGGSILYDPTIAAGSGLIIILCCAVGLVILVLLLLYRTHFSLSWRRRFLLEIGLLLAGFLACLVVAEAHSASHSSTQAYDQTLGIAFVAYGLVAAFVAFW